MSDKIIRIQIEADGRQYTAEIDRAASKTKAFGTAGTAAAGGIRKADRATGRFSRTARSSTASLHHMRTALSGVAGAIAALGVIRMEKALIDANLEMQRIDNALRSATGSSEGAAREFAFVSQTADQLGLDLRSTASQYASLAAAARGTALEGQASRDILVGISEAATVLGLSAEQTGGALTAIQQIISKGTVSAEELRGQLGERLPGAFQLAAKSMGVTTQALGKMLQKGEVASADFLPRFARALHEAFGEQAQGAARGLQQEINRLTTAFFKIQTGGDVDGLTQSIGDMAETLTDPGTKAGFQALAQGLIEIANLAVQATSAVVNFTSDIAQNIAADVHGAAIGDLERLNAQLREAQSLRATSEYNPRRMASFGDNGGLGFEGYVSNDDLDARIAKLKQSIALSEDLGSAAATLRPINVTGEAVPDRSAGARDRPSAAAKAQRSAAAQAMKNLEREIALLGTKTELERVNAQLAIGAYGQISTARAQSLRQLAAEKDAQQAKLDLQQRVADMVEDAQRDNESALQAEQRRYQAEVAALQQAVDKKIEILGGYESAREALALRHGNRRAEIMLDSARRASDGAGAAADKTAEQLASIQRAAEDVGASFEDAFVQMARTGKFEMKSMVDSIIADLARLIAQKRIVEPLLNAAVGKDGGGGGWLDTVGSMVGSWLGGGTPAPNTSLRGGNVMGSLPSVNFGTGHAGAVIGEAATGSARVDPRVFAGAPRHHAGTGGLGTDEVPFIGRRGEGVFTEAQMGKLAPAGGNAAGVTINIYGVEGEPERSERTGPDGAKIIDLVWPGVQDRLIRDQNSNGPVTQNQQQVFPGLQRGGTAR